MTHPVLGSGLAASFFYLVIAPDEQVELLDAMQLAVDGSTACAQIQLLVGRTADTTTLATTAGRIAVVHDGGAEADPGLADNPTARDVVAALGGPDRRRGGMHVVCAGGPEGTLAGLTVDQVELISDAIRQRRIAHWPVRVDAV